MYPLVLVLLVLTILILLFEALIHYNMGYSKLIDKLQYVNSECKISDNIDLDHILPWKIKIGSITFYIPDINELVIMIIIIILFYFVIDFFIKKLFYK